MHPGPNFVTHSINLSDMTKARLPLSARICKYFNQYVLQFFEYKIAVATESHPRVGVAVLALKRP